MSSTTASRAFWALSSVGAVYAVFIGLLTVPSVQRFALFANWFHTAWWDDLNRPESFGFATNQVTPVNLTTPDGETLFAWHVLPLGLYAQHKDDILAQPPGTPFAQSLNFQLLTQDPNARLIINFHGNAGHLAQHTRVPSLRALSSLPPLSTPQIHTHILTFDYRGFGLSTGTPTQPGLTLDALTVLAYARTRLQIPPARTILFGTSLGSGVASAALGAIANGSAPALVAGAPRPDAADYAGVLLAGAFDSIPNLMRSYNILKFIPVLSPLKTLPWVLDRVDGMILDRFHSASALGLAASRLPRLRLRLLHARNDFDITWPHSDELFYAAVGGVDADAARALRRETPAELSARDVGADGQWARAWARGGVHVAQRIVLYGGHNGVIGQVPAVLEMLALVEGGEVVEE